MTAQTIIRDAEIAIREIEELGYQGEADMWRVAFYDAASEDRRYVITDMKAQLAAMWKAQRV